MLLIGPNAFVFTVYSVLFEAKMKNKQYQTILLYELK